MRPKLIFKENQSMLIELKSFIKTELSLSERLPHAISLLNKLSELI